MHTLRPEWLQHTQQYMLQQVFQMLTASLDCWMSWAGAGSRLGALLQYMLSSACGNLKLCNAWHICLPWLLGWCHTRLQCG